MEGTIEALYENVNDEMRIRVSMDMAGEELAGDYTSYSQNWDESIQGITVRCKGDGETINNALFDAEDLHYAILYNAGDEGYGLTADELNAIVTGMQIAEYPEEPEMAETENAGVPAATADPTDESVPAGGSCLYIATAENADYYEWHAVSQDGSIDIPYAEIATWFPELQYSGEDSEYLSLSNIPLEFNGWSSYCRFTNDAGTSDSGKAVTYVQNDNTAG